MHRPRILLVDDDPMMRDLVSQNLRNDQYDVTTASSGVDGLAATEREHPDLVLIDATMPDCDAVHLAQQMRENPATRQTPIILLTVFHGAGGSARTMDAAGADDFVCKPFSHAILMSRIREVLERKSA